MELKYLSLFTGIGGFELGIQQAYEETKTKPQNSTNSKSRTPQHIRRSLCIGYSEIDKYAIQVFEKHFPDIKNYGDITKIREEELPDFDLICGGFPCQSFSIAGKRRGFEDTRGTLFFDIARIIKSKRPRLVFLENVKGLLSHDDGRTFNTIILTLDELGYDIQWQVLNSKNFGVPQNRERVFIIGHLRGTPRPKVFPFVQSTTKTTSKVIGNIYKSGHEAGNIYDQKGISPTIKCNGPRPNSKNITPKIVQLNKPKHSNNRVYGENGISPALNTAQGGNRQPKIAPTMRAEHHNTADVHFVPVNSKIRRLTPTECERLQGFPDGWTEGLSDTQRYKTLGNAVTVNVIKAIAKTLL